MIKRKCFAIYEKALGQLERIHAQEHEIQIIASVSKRCFNRCRQEWLGIDGQGTISI